MSDVTQILQAMEHGDPQAANELLTLVYDELRRVAAHKMAHEARGQTLQPTAWCMKRGCTLAGINNQPGKIARISSARRRKPCGASWWIALVRRRR